MNHHPPLISVIIPVYNAEIYFSDVFEKIANQTLLDIEIIIVDDQSTDNTYNLISKYAENDNRIIILQNEKKGGAGASRNKGLLVATGQYVIFLDDDDFIENTMLEKMYNSALQQNADIVVCHAKFIDWYTKEFVNHHANIQKDLLPSACCFAGEDIKYDFFNVFTWWAWDKLYKREFVIKSKIQFQEIRTSNDLVFTTSLMLLASRITIQAEVLIYHTVSRKNSLSNLRGLSWECALTALKGLKQFLDETSLFASRKQDFDNYVLSFLKWHLDTLSGEAYYKLFNSAQSFIQACHIETSNIYQIEIISFFEDIMHLPAHYYLIKKQTKEEIDSISKNVEHLLSQEQNGWANDRFNILNSKIEQLLSQEQNGWANDRFNILNSKIEQLLSQEQNGWANDRFNILNSKIEQLLSQEQNGWANDRFNILNSKIEQLLSQEQDGWANDRFNILNSKIEQLLSQEQDGWANDRFNILNNKIEQLLSQEQNGWANDRFNILNSKIEYLLSQEQDGWANDRFNVLDNKINQLIKIQQSKSGISNFFSKIKKHLKIFFKPS